MDLNQNSFPLMINQMVSNKDKQAIRMSFHTNLEKWRSYLKTENCPICKNDPMPEGMEDVFELEYTWLNAEPKECIYGACHVIAKKHAIEIYDLSDKELLGFMKEVALYAKALKEVTNAIKINYEIHGNTIPHLHVHLYPRYIDDPHANRPIDTYNKNDQVYSEGEYENFIQKLKQTISELNTKKD
ncbi:MAG: HIT family protein [Asgard group archaeon]|nr:HIT family protein [Asgard group archaeon]